MRGSTLLALPIFLFIALSLPRVQAIYAPAPLLVRRLVAESEARPPVPGVVHRDVTYTWLGLRPLRLDVYEPTVAFAEGRAPAVVFYHGGSWIQGDKITIRVVDRFLDRMRARGYFVIAVNYTTSILRGLRGPVRATERSLLWIAENAARFGYDPGNLGLYGVSAGGHVALMAASRLSAPVDERDDSTHSLNLAFAFIECAPTDLIAMREGDAFENSSTFRVFPERVLRELSPVEHVHAGLPPVLIFHGGLDEVVHIDQSRRYVDAVREAGGTAELVVYPDGDHAFLNLPDDVWYRQESRALEFFAREFGS